jgi:hypothetical protein
MEALWGDVTQPALSEGQRLLLAMIWLTLNQDSYQTLKAYQAFDQELIDDLEQLLMSLYGFARFSMQVRSKYETDLVRRCLATSVRLFFQPYLSSSGGK